jgi:hypothetical protein
VSLRIHEGNRYSRRDDLISLGYVYLWMLGEFILIRQIEKSECSPIDLNYPLNVWLREQKKCFVSCLQDKELIGEGIVHYMEYVYAMSYDEVPKYEPMKMVFQPDVEIAPIT